MLPFIFSRSVSLCLSHSHTITSSLIVSCPPHSTRPPPSASSILFNHSPVSAPESPLLAFSSPLTTPARHVNRKWLRENERGVSWKAFAHLGYFPVTGSQVLSVPGHLWVRPWASPPNSKYHVKKEQETNSELSVLPVTGGRWNSGPENLLSQGTWEWIPQLCPLLHRADVWTPL